MAGATAPGLTAAFKYDVLNRRSEKTVNYIYDGAQVIAKVTNGTVSAAILTDALDSVIAQANHTQAIDNYYA